MVTTDLRKAAVVLLSLPEDQAARLLAQLDPSQVESITTEIAGCESVTSREQRAVLAEFVATDPRTVAKHGGVEVAKSLVNRAFGNKRRTGDSIRQSVAAVPFSFLKHLDARGLASLLADEQPQTVALVLSQLPTAQGAEILDCLPFDVQGSVARRIAVMEQTSPEIVAEIAQRIGIAPDSGRRRASDGVGWHESRGRNPQRIASRHPATGARQPGSRRSTACR